MIFDMNKEDTEKKKSWLHLTFKQSLIISVCYFVSLGIVIHYNNITLSAQTDTITKVRHDRGVRRGLTFYYSKDSNILSRTGSSLTGNMELRRLGLSGNMKNLNMNVSYYTMPGHKWPVGLRLGRDKYPHDVWYYWTLYSATICDSFFLLATFFVFGIGCIYRKSGVGGKILIIYRYLCFIYIIFVIFIL